MTGSDRQPHDQAYWDDRYRSGTAVWSGDPNPQLVAEADGLTPGFALDAGAGEGADAIWLARRGWSVTAVDISAVALERAAQHAARADRAAARRIRWVRHDLLEGEPPERGYDLVTAQYLQMPSDSRPLLFAQLAASVDAGGTLLIVGHHPSDLQTAVRRPPDPDVFFTGDEIAGQLGEGEGWRIITNAAVPRTATDPDGRSVTVHDTVFRAVRAS